MAEREVEVDFADVSASERPYLPPAVAVSTVAFALNPPSGALVVGEGVRHDAAGESSATLWIPLVRRTRAPYLGRWALPGGPTRWDETLADTALRSIRAAAQCTPGYLEQLYAFGGVERSADAQRLVTIAYWAMLGEDDLSTAVPGGAEGGSTGASTAEQAGGRRWDDPRVDPPRVDPPRVDPPRAETGAAIDESGRADANVAWCSADALPDLAFDHSAITDYALARLRSKTEYAAVAHRFLGPVFTIGQLRAVHEAVLGYAVDPANFRRQILARGALIDTGERETGSPHRPARLYRFSNEAAPEFPDARPQPRRPA